MRSPWPPNPCETDRDSCHEEALPQEKHHWMKALLIKLSKQDWLLVCFVCFVWLHGWLIQWVIGHHPSIHNSKPKGYSKHCMWNKSSTKPRNQSLAWLIFTHRREAGVSNGKSPCWRNSLITFTMSSGVWQVFPNRTIYRDNLPNTWSTSSCECPDRRQLIAASRMIPQAMVIKKQEKKTSLSDDELW